MKAHFFLPFAAAAAMVAACGNDIPAQTPETPDTPENTALYIDGEFPIIAWTGIDAKDTGSKFGPMKDCGINVYLGWYGTLDEVLSALDNAEKAGVKLIIKSDELVSDTENTARQMMDHPALFCYHIDDEPEVSEFTALATIVKNIRAVDSTHPCYINLYPNWAWGGADGYLAKVLSFLSAVPVSFLSFDHYPVIETGGTSSLRPWWYKNLEDVRRASQAKNMPFWAFALALSHSVDDVKYPIPTVAELRLQMFSNLAYGAQGFQYFTYWGIYQSAPTQVYERVRTVNRELQALSKIFLGATVTDVWHTGTEIPYGTKALTSLPDGISALSTPGGGAVVSSVEKDGNRYIAIVNRDCKEEMTLDITFSGKAYKIDKEMNRGTAASGKTSVAAGDIAIYQLL